MSYKPLLLLWLLLPLLQAYTDITLLNCPAQFDIVKYNSTTDTTVSTMGPLVYAGFSSSASTDRVNQIVITGDQPQLEEYESELMVPYIIMAVVYGVFYIFTIFCCLFDRSCPPSECIRRDLDTNPYSKK